MTFRHVLFQLEVSFNTKFRIEMRKGILNVFICSPDELSALGGVIFFLSSLRLLRDINSATMVYQITVVFQFYYFQKRTPWKNTSRPFRDWRAVRGQKSEISKGKNWRHENIQSRYSRKTENSYWNEAQKCTFLTHQLPS